jgi:hypothetical protein
LFFTAMDGGDAENAGAIFTATEGGDAENAGAIFTATESGDAENAGAIFGRASMARLRQTKDQFPAAQTSLRSCRAGAMLTDPL